MTYFFSIFFGTFVLEDVALASALTLTVSGKMSAVSGFLACFFGIAIGDLLIYVTGTLIGRFGLENRFKSVRKFRAALVNEKHADVLTNSIVIARFIPGTRLPTYLTAGIFRYPFWRFTLLTVVTVFLWVVCAFAIGQSVRSVLMDHWAITIILVLLFLKVVRFLIPKLSDRWERKALRHAWRRWLHFEFWPSTLFYLPIIPYYFCLSVKHRSFLLPFYAAPDIENGGLIGESKWDFLKSLDRSSPHTLPSMKIGPQNNFSVARALIEKSGFSYPFILKPDVGQRGFGVRIIRDDFDLTEYLLLADFDIIVQAISKWPGEAGIFYVKYPDSDEHLIFSITDKRFPYVTGDGLHTLGDLILKDRRARIIAPTYFARLRERLDHVPSAGEVVALSECGNHCQGAIFLDGRDLITVQLAAEIRKVAHQLPHFYFGRFDVRYKDRSSLMNGQDFEIVEVNGAGSEATHIWDSQTSLIEAYKTLFVQWRMLFEIGLRIKRDPKIKARLCLRNFFNQSFKVFFRKDALSVSS